MSSGEPRYATEMSEPGKRLLRIRARIVASGEFVTEDNESDRGRR